MAKSGGSGGKKTTAPKTTALPTSVKDITKFETQASKLREQLEAAEKSAQEALATRQTELTSARDKEKADYETKAAAAKASYDDKAAKLQATFTEESTKLLAEFEGVDSKLKTELDEINMKMGIAPTLDIPVVDNGNAPGVDDEDYIEAKMPKRLALGDDETGKRDEDFWNSLMRLPFYPASLDEYIVLVCANAGKDEEVNYDTMAAAAIALGHESSSKNFKGSCAARCNQLKNSLGLLKQTRRGWFAASTKGRKLITDRTVEYKAESDTPGSVTDGLERQILTVAASEKSPLSGGQTIKKVLDAGYQFPQDAKPADIQKACTKALENLQKQRCFIVKKDGKGHNVLELTDKGVKEAEFAAA